MSLLLDPHLTAGLLMLAIPISLGFYLTRRFHLGWRLWWIGAAGFILSQIGHIPFNGLVNNLFLNGTLPLELGRNAIFGALFGGLSAGLWEELTRTAVYKFLAKDARSWQRGVLLGAGHGGIEALITALFVLGTFGYMAAIRNADLSTIVPPEQMGLAKQQMEAYWAVSWGLGMMGPLERALTIPLHIAFSVIVLQAFVRGQARWVGFAILFHAAVDAAIVYLGRVWQGQPWSPYALEGVLAAFTVAAILIIFALRSPEPIEEPAVIDEAGLPAASINPAEIQLQPTDEDIDRSRYS